MAKKMLIDATHAEETRVVVVDGYKVDDFDFESVNKRQLAGNIYLAKVTRVEPSLQAAFVDYGGNRHGFLAFSEIHPDYYQIPVADREALLAEERALAEAMDEDEGGDKPRPKRRSRSRRSPKDEAMEVESASEADVEVQPEGESSEPEAETGDDTPPSATMAASARSDDPVETREPASIPGMDVVDLGEEDVAALPVEDAADAAKPRRPSRRRRKPARKSGEAPADTDAPSPEPVAEEGEDNSVDVVERDDQIESIAEEDVTEEIRRPKPRLRRYKIQEVIKVRQIMLVQVVKEERGNKGAALTTYLSLAGRYCVLMPNTARGGGISRKITNAADRKKLKEIAAELEVPEGAGLIIRTAGSQRTKSEIRRDYEYLQRLWEQIRELTLKSIAPAPIYEEGDLIKRSIRDLYSREIDEVLVEGERGYRVAKDFMKMIMPSHAKNVRHYTEQMPLFARFQVESYLSSMFNPTVQLKSGGYIVIGVTEALVAIDVNSGRATKEGSIEETALKTNLEAAEEVARQLRLRDLAGLIVIDFIDMEERKNNAAVEKRLKDKLKNDRARIQIGRISGFGLLEMSRQRLRPGMIEATTQPCPHCHGTGLIRSDDNLALAILRQLEEEGVRARSREVLLKAPIGIVNYLMNQKREHIAQIEARYGLSVRVEADPFLISPDFSIERFKTATRAVPEVSAPVISVDTSDMPDLAEEIETAEPEAAPAAVAVAGEEDKPKKRRRRRRRKKPGQTDEEARLEEAAADEDEAEEGAAGEAEAVPLADAAEDAGEAETAPKKGRSRRSRGSRASKPEPAAEPMAEDAEAEAMPEPEAEEAASDVQTGAAAMPEPEAAEAASDVQTEAAAMPEPEAAEAASDIQPETEAEALPKVEAEAEVQPAPAPELVEQGDESAKAEPASRKRGWWSLGR
ncbi:Rne/Rng family ribonuclease [Rhodovulum tesquicola]|uniref:ribonuclease E/G n=1 Tax=Rhodovulum tesquicola TaxID=540254 RepID=UPI0020976C52|nr:ribonuclease E/G [Rhodovulum tesquicola]MCO8144903.1 Rne/Rng family ribonuclease [Rhodovulum tesquicola]